MLDGSKRWAYNGDMKQRTDLGTLPENETDDGPELCEHDYELDCPHAVCELRDAADAEDAQS